MTYAHFVDRLTCPAEHGIHDLHVVHVMYKPCDWSGDSVATTARIEVDGEHSKGPFLRSGTAKTKAVAEGSWAWRDWVGTCAH